MSSTGPKRSLTLRRHSRSPSCRSSTPPATSARKNRSQLPHTISGTADGADAVVERAQQIASYGLDFELLHLLVSRESMALSLHNTARREDAVLDEYLATVCRLRDV
ncbi:hypothetical protein ABZ953_02105 [Streptomyces sp. NPDC046465]|uniref:hypothetical protein n=1 Tax=Streptomyces sp. NPDC046465 TaxID=3155810 RepID=UPI0033F7D0BF